MVNNEAYEQWIAVLEERTEVSERKGMDVIIKKIPDSDRVGEFDPRVLRVNQEEAQAEADRPMPDDHSEQDPIRMAFLATVCAMKDRDEGTRMIKYQALIYPTVNMAGVETDDFTWSTDQYTIHNDRELIMAALIGMGELTKMLEPIYVQGKEDVTHPYLSPLLADDLSKMPETLIITAEYNYLRLEDEAYARKLQCAGVKTGLIQYNGVDHAFMDKLGLYPQAEDCMNEIAKRIKNFFA